PTAPQDTRGQPFHVQAREALDVLLRQPSGWCLVENKDKQMAWFPSPYLEEVAPGQVREGDTAAREAGLQFCASRAYKSGGANESVPAGAQVRVLERSDCAWCLSKCVGRAGLLSAVLLRPDALGALL
uniref:SH3 domain-containing protein n=1 Tax=Loxodonta africana TaxID=9785 RepID=G3SUS8_LOXAF